MLLLDTDKDNFDAGTETEKGQAGVGAVAPRFPTVRAQDHLFPVHLALRCCATQAQLLLPWPFTEGPGAPASR